MTAILKKELWTYIGNWSAWVILASFSVIGTLFLFFFDNDSNVFEIGAASLQSYFGLVPWLMMMLIPAISMKALAEEEQNGTLQWLFSQPVRVFEIVAGKFLAVWLMAVMCLVPSVIYLFTISELAVPAGNIDWGATVGSYSGLIILAAAFSAVGILSSSLAKNQVMAYLLGVFMSFILYFGAEQLASYKLLGSADYYLSALGFYQHFNAFTRGLVDTRDLFYFITVSAICLTLATLFVEKKK